MSNLNNKGNYMLGVAPNKNSPSKTLINQLKQLESTNLNSLRNNSFLNEEKKNLKNVLKSIFNKLEHDVYTINNKINNFNLEKKKLNEIHSNELSKLKNIIVKLYSIIVKINEALSLKTNEKASLLLQLRKNIENNKNFTSLIDQIIGYKNISNINVSSKSNNNGSLSELFENINNGKNINVEQTLERPEENILNFSNQNQKSNQVEENFYQTPRENNLEDLYQSTEIPKENSSNNSNLLNTKSNTSNNLNTSNNPNTRVNNNLFNRVNNNPNTRVNNTLNTRVNNNPNTSNNPFNRVNNTLNTRVNNNPFNRVNNNPNTRVNNNPFNRVNKSNIEEISYNNSRNNNRSNNTIFNENNVFTNQKNSELTTMNKISKTNMPQNKANLLLNEYISKKNTKINNRFL